MCLSGSCFVPRLVSQCLCPRGCVWITVSQCLCFSFCVLCVVCWGLAFGGSGALMGIMIGLADRAPVPEPIIWRNRCSCQNTTTTWCTTDIWKFSCIGLRCGARGQWGWHDKCCCHLTVPLSPLSRTESITVRQKENLYLWQSMQSIQGLQSVQGMQSTQRIHTKYTIDKYICKVYKNTCKACKVGKDHGSQISQITDWADHRRGKKSMNKKSKQNYEKKNWFIKVDPPLYNTGMLYL